MFPAGVELYKDYVAAVGPHEEPNTIYCRIFPNCSAGQLEELRSMAVEDDDGVVDSCITRTECPSNNTDGAEIQFIPIQPGEEDIGFDEEWELEWEDDDDEDREDDEDNDNGDEPPRQA